MITNHQRLLRRRALGASDLPAVLGVDPYRSPADIQLEKLHGAEAVETDAMRVGTALERPIIKLAEPWIGPTHFKATRRRLADAPIVVNIDAFAGVVPVEAKVVGDYAAKEWGDSGTDQVPSRVVVQTTAQMAAVGADHCYVVALIGGTSLRVYRLAFDSELATWIVNNATGWWERHVINKAPVTGARPSLELLSRIRREPGKTIPLDSRAEELIGTWSMAREKRLAAEKIEDEFKADILALLEDAEIGTLPNGARIEYICTKTRRLDQKALAAGYPEAYAACMRETITRTMRLKGAGDVRRMLGASTGGENGIGTEVSGGDGTTRGRAADPG